MIANRTAYLEEANFLVRWAKNINPELDLDRELKQIKERWEKSANTLKKQTQPPLVGARIPRPQSMRSIVKLAKESQKKE
jgi:hypothetical protein